MTGRQLAATIVIIGGALLGASIVADYIGIGNDRGFGGRQGMGALAGVLILCLGLVGIRKAD
jgi:hypothetical protein